MRTIDLLCGLAIFQGYNPAPRITCDASEGILHVHDEGFRGSVTPDDVDRLETLGWQYDLDAEAWYFQAEVAELMTA
jgi:hypothetical protein